MNIVLIFCSANYLKVSRVKLTVTDLEVAHEANTSRNCKLSVIAVRERVSLFLGAMSGFSEVDSAC